MRRFARFACLDWSGAKGARQSGIAVAVCDAGRAAPALIRPPEGWSRPGALDWIRDRKAADMLIGIDFSAALPFVDEGAYFPGWSDSPSDARGLWALVERLCDADPHLAAAGLVDHAQASRHFRRHGGRLGDRFGLRPGGRLRVTERRVRDAFGITPQSGFNLVGAAQVGKSSLTGMRLLHRLDGHVPNWPFDPVPATGAVLVEIYTTVAARAAGVARGRSKLRDAAALDAALAALGSAPHPAQTLRRSQHRCDRHRRLAPPRRCRPGLMVARGPRSAPRRHRGLDLRSTLTHSGADAGLAQLVEQPICNR